MGSFACSSVASPPCARRILELKNSSVKSCREFDYATSSACLLPLHAGFFSLRCGVYESFI
jgi:hypothetical protein